MPKHVASGLMFGHPMTIAVPDLDRTDFLLMLGANPLESNGSLCTAPDFPGRLKALRETRWAADAWSTRAGRAPPNWPTSTSSSSRAPTRSCWPGSRTRSSPRGSSRSDLPVEGLAEVEAVGQGLPAAGGGGRLRRPAEVSVRLARALAAAPSAAVYARIGTCTAEFGTVTQWLVDVLNVLTGNLDRPGGAMFPTPATEGRAGASRTGPEDGPAGSAA